MKRNWNTQSAASDAVSSSTAAASENQKRVHNTYTHIYRETDRNIIAKPS